jgi:hypothetical protein
MKKIEINVETGEILELEMTETELAQREASQIAEETIKSARAHERAALLERLGITEEEAKLLLS